MKKAIALCLTAVMAASLLTGCGGKTTETTAAAENKTETTAGAAAEEKKDEAAGVVKVIEYDLTDEQYAFGVDKDQPELLEQVNAFIAKIQEDGTFDTICDKYFSDGEPAAVESAEYDASKDQLVVAANASDSAAMRYYAPFAGATIGEYFRDSGRHALVVYDDLSKQAVAYREISLILRRPSGREAYPGDIFYLHSRLLERAARIISSDEMAQTMNDLPDVLKPTAKGGGSLTALPIIETQAGDVSAYIPTNVISITDGQIFLEAGLFNEGVRPAINVGISVSRVGGNAQVKAMKKIAGTLKIDQAQYRELEAFSKFGGDMDSVTEMVIDKGRKNAQLLIQPQHAPMPVEEEIAVIYCGTQGLLRNVELKHVAEFEKMFLEILRSKYQKEILEPLREGVLDENVSKLLEEVATEVGQTFN